MDDARSELVISAAPGKGRNNLVILAFAFVMSCTGAVLADATWERTGSVLAAVLVAVIGIGGRNRITGKEPLLTARADGLHHRYLGHISWKHVTAAVPRYGGFLPGLAISVAEPDLYIARAPLGLRILMRIDRFFSSALLVLPAGLLPLPVDDLKHRLEKLAGRSL